MQNVSNNITRVCMFALLCFHTALCKTHLSILFFIHNQTYLSELCFVVNKNYFKKVQFYKTLEDGDKNLSQKVAWWSVACVLYSVLGIKRWCDGCGFEQGSVEGCDYCESTSLSSEGLMVKLSCLLYHCGSGPLVVFMWKEFTVVQVGWVDIHVLLIRMVVVVVWNR